MTTKEVCCDSVMRFTGQAIPAPAGFEVVFQEAGGRFSREPLLAFGSFAYEPVFNKGVSRTARGLRRCFSCGEVEDERPLMELVAMWRNSGAGGALLEDPMLLPPDVRVVGIFGPGEWNATAEPMARDVGLHGARVVETPRGGAR